MAKQIHYTTPYEAGKRDAQAGFYDKWYNYYGNADEYNRGWEESKREDVNYKIIPCITTLK